MTMEHYYDVVSNTKEEVAKCLLNLADCDSDFSGDNGPEYLWDDAEGFESNAEYCLSIAETMSTTREMVEKFISLWMGADPYYFSYDIGILVKGDMLFISLAYTTRV